MTTNSQSGILKPAVGALAILLGACGGGGGSDTSAASPSTGLSRTPTYQAAPDAQYATSEFLVNPAATWEPLQYADDGSLGSVLVIELAKLVPAGTSPVGVTFDVQARGWFDASVNPLTSAPLIRYDLAAVFVDAAGAVVARVASNGLVDAVSAVCDGDTPKEDPFVGDFVIKPTAGKLTVPAGATHLRISADDCHYRDNKTSATDPLRLYIKRSS